MSLTKIAMDETAIIQTFLLGQEPGYSLVKGWIDSVVYFNGWGQRIDAAELRQEAIVAVLQNLREEKFRGGSVKSYVYSTCKNLCLLALRRSYRNKTASIEGRDFASDAANPEEDLLKTEEYGVFSRVFSQLGQQCKKLLVLRIVKSLHFSEIASKMSITEGAARVRFFRCIEKARNLKEKLNSL